jgi:hypothetical protein
MIVFRFGLLVVAALVLKLAALWGVGVVVVLVVLLVLVPGSMGRGRQGQTSVLLTVRGVCRECWGAARPDRAAISPQRVRGQRRVLLAGAETAFRR